MRHGLWMISLGAMACKSVNKNYGMVATSAIEAQEQEIWSRPLEVGFSMDAKSKKCTSSTTKLLGVLRVAGDPVSTIPSVTILGASNGLSSNAKFAVADCVEKLKGDGMYVTYSEDKKTMTGLTVTTSSVVRGRILRLEDYGPVDEAVINAVRTGSQMTLVPGQFPREPKTVSKETTE